MPRIGHHIMLRCDDDRVLAPSTAQRRALARAVHRATRDLPLLAFGAADTHLHLELLGDRATAGAAAQRVACSLHWALDLGVPFAPTRTKPLADHAHERSTFHYVLNQHRRHGTSNDPPLDATSLPDLLGLRVLGTDDLLLRVREHFPRLQRGDLLPHLGVEELEPVSQDLLEAVAVEGHHALLRDAAAGAIALGTLEGRAPRVVEARTALVHLLAPCCSPATVGAVVERTDSVIRRTRQRPENPALQRAIGLRIDLHVRMSSTVHNPAP